MLYFLFGGRKILWVVGAWSIPPADEFGAIPGIDPTDADSIIYAMHLLRK